MREGVCAWGFSLHPPAQVKHCSRPRRMQLSSSLSVLTRGCGSPPTKAAPPMWNLPAPDVGGPSVSQLFLGSPEVQGQGTAYFDMATPRPVG